MLRSTLVSTGGPTLQSSLHCRWGETQSCAPNQPNQIHTTPNTELRRSRTNPKADLLYLVQQATNTSSIFSNQTSSQSLSPKPSEPNSIKNPYPLLLES